MITNDEIIKIGKIQKTHALKGELNLISDVDAEYFKSGNPIIIYYDGLLVPYYAESIRPKGSTSYLIKLDGIDSEEEASKFVNKEIFMLKKDAEDWFEPEEIEEDELIGYEVYYQTDENTEEKIGVLEAFDESTENVLMIVKQEDGNEVFIPAIEDFILEIDDDKKVIRMDLPEGLVDLNRK